MAKSTSLKKLKKELSRWFHFDWEDDNVLSIQLEPNSFVLGFFLADPERPNAIVLSCALDFEDPFTIAHLCIEACHIQNIVLGEGFYVSNDERILWGEEAHRRMEFEKLPPNVVENNSKLLN